MFHCYLHILKFDEKVTPVENNAAICFTSVSVQKL